jgi:hypothetical protein
MPVHALIFYLAILLVPLASGCSPFGEDRGFLTSPRIGLPTFWFVHERVEGLVLDLASCQYINDTKEYVEFMPSMCRPIAGAQVRLEQRFRPTSIEPDYIATAHTGSDGKFVISKETKFRLYGYSKHERNKMGGNGKIFISADGYKEVKKTIYWSLDRDKYAIETVVSSRKSSEESIEGHMVVILTIGEPESVIRVPPDM